MHFFLTESQFPLFLNYFDTISDAILPKFRDMFEIFESFKLLLRIRVSYNWAEKNLIFSYKKLNVGTIIKMSPPKMFPNISCKQYILHLQNMYVQTIFCSFLRLQNFRQLYRYMPGYSTFLFMIREMWLSNGKHSNSQIFASLKDWIFKW